MLILGHKIIGTGLKKILFLHELMGDSQNYEPILPYLDTENFSYIFVDLRGYGLSKNFMGEYSCHEAAMDIKNLITFLVLEEVVIVAHSMSTMIAQKIALIDLRVTKLILITPITAAGVKLSKIAENSLLKGMAENKSKIEEIVHSASKRYNSTWSKNRIKIGYASSTVEARVGYMKMYLQTNFLEEAKHIAIPLKIIVGKYDFPLFGLAFVTKSFLLEYRDVEIIECQEAGHYPMIESPVYFASKIEAFCTSH